MRWKSQYIAGLDIRFTIYQPQSEPEFTAYCEILKAGS